MILKKKIGVGLMFFIFGLFIFEKMTNMLLSASIAKAVCGKTYMVEPDQTLREQNILTDMACGFDVDIQFVAVLIVLLLISLVLILWPFVPRKEMNDSNN